MADDPGRVMLQLLRSRLVALLDEARKAAEQAVQLETLIAAGEPWTGTALEGRLLTAIESATSTNPLTARVLEALAKLEEVTGATAEGGLFGWDPDPTGGAEPRGVAYALRIENDGSGRQLAAALALTAPGGVPRLSIVASGSIEDLSAELPLDENWTLRAGARTAGTLDVSIAAEGDPIVAPGTSDGDVARLDLSRKSSDDDDEPGISLGAVELSAVTEIAPGGKPGLTGRLAIHDGAVRLAPGDLSKILPALGPIPLDLDVGLDSARGVDVSGSTTLSAQLPVAASIPGISAGPLDITLEPGVGTGGFSVQVGVAAGLAFELPGVPIELDLKGAGIELPFSLGDGEALGFDPSKLVPKPPTGAGVELALPVINGAGSVDRDPSGEYSGLLAVVLPPLSVNAFGLLGLQPLSFLVILGATFPLPGIQIGFGFAITGLGGVVGVNRRVDRDALSRAVTDGTAASLLFPTDPSEDAERVMAALPGIFPPAPGRAIVGPMFQISWGGRLLSASVALLLELPDPVRISILGKLLLAVPDPELPLVQIQVTFFGSVDPGEPSISFLASLSGSSIAGIPLTGDVFFLTRGGQDAEFVLSAGGFHPQFARPRGVPELARLGMDLSPAPFLDLRCAAYLAVTSNTVQFGARVDLVAEIADCGLRGHLAFDVLVQLQPLHFVADVSIGIAVEVFGETLAGIDLSLTLEGPAPWRARGRGSVDLFLFSASFDFDETWGQPPPTPLSTPDVARLLADAIRAPDAWKASPPDPAASPVQLTDAAAHALARGTVVHPHGSLRVHQRVVPLGITIERFNRLAVAPQRWDVGAPALGQDRPVDATLEEREQFAPGQFLALTDAEQLSRPAFESFRVGLGFVAAGITDAKARPADIDYEVKVIATDTPAQPMQLDIGALLMPAQTVVAAGIEHPLWWDQPVEGVTVEASPTFAVADAWSFTQAPDIQPAGDTATEWHQAVAAVEEADPHRRIGVVEAWEVAV